MNIKDMPYTEYYYIFEIDCVKQACSIVNNLEYLVNENKNIYIQDKVFVTNYAKDFNRVSTHLITRENINDYNDYENSMKTLAIINAKIQAILYNYNLPNINLYINDYCKHINSLLAFTHTAKDIIMQNHSAIIILLLLPILILVLILILFKNNIDILIITLCLLVIYTLGTFLLAIKSIKKHSKLNKINRIINLNTYYNSRKIKKYQKTLIKLTKSISNIKRNS